MEDMRAEMDRLFSQVYGGGRFLPPGGVSDRMLPAIRGEFRVDVRDQENEVVVVADLPGIEKKDVSIRLINPHALEITCERKGETEEKAKGYYMRERVAGSMQRVVILPADVTETDAKAGFKNGVLEVHLKHSKVPQVSNIPIE
ncbi:MAG TPA: Hsp20/alpha crystallin family protein [Methanoregula sp.]|nr:Hsp20/alpha crystallin family protein [Methanoregula sp.]